MKLSVVWNDRDGEGRLSKADAQRLRDIAQESIGGYVTVLDFLTDVLDLTEELYEELRAGESAREAAVMSVMGHQ